MPAESNLIGTGRIVVLAAGIAMAGWALWGADEGLSRIVWLVLAGAVIVMGIIGYLPLLPKKSAKAN